MVIMRQRHTDGKHCSDVSEGSGQLQKNHDKVAIFLRFQIINPFPLSRLNIS